MTVDWKALAAEVIASLSPIEREASIAYLERRVVPAGEQLPWPGMRRAFDEDVIVAFVDLEPELNWTHRGRYLVLGVAGGIRHAVDVDRPPFLTEVSPCLRLIHQGRKAPAWAVVTPESLE